MVAEKVKTDQNWQLWTTLGVIITVMLGYVSWSNSQMMQHIDLRLQPLVQAVEENTESRKKGGRYTDIDADRDLARIRNEIATCKNGRKAEDSRLHTRIDQLFQKMFEFHSAHAHDILMNNSPKP